MKTLKVICKSFSDDLRDKSKVNLELRMKDGRIYRFRNLYRSQGIDNNRKRVAYVKVDSRYKEEDFLSARFWYQSGSGFLWSTDNWSAAPLVVTTDNGFPLFYEDYHRFTGASHEVLVHRKF